MPEPGRTFNQRLAQRLADELKDGITALEQAISFLEATGHARRVPTVAELTTACDGLRRTVLALSAARVQTVNVTTQKQIAEIERAAMRLYMDCRQLRRALMAEGRGDDDET